MHSHQWAWHRAKSALAACAGWGEWPGCGPAGHAWEGRTDEGFEGGFGGGLGVRRPLRFLAHRLGLDERQVAELARILNELKTERAQAEVDRRRTVAALADALAGDVFDAAKAAHEGGDLARKSRAARAACARRGAQGAAADPRGAISRAAASGSLT